MAWVFQAGSLVCPDWVLISDSQQQNRFANGRFRLMTPWATFQENWHFGNYNGLLSAGEFWLALPKRIGYGRIRLSAFGQVGVDKDFHAEDGEQDNVNQGDNPDGRWQLWRQ